MNIYQIFTETLMLVAVLNPFGNVPLFVGMTEKMEKETRKKGNENNDEETKD